MLLGGVPEEWFRAKAAWGFGNLPTWFGPCALSFVPQENGAALSLGGKVASPGGFVLRLPPALKAGVTVDGRPITPAANGDVLLPPGTRNVELRWNN